MDSQFYIVLNLKTTDGWESFGRFFLGNSKVHAYDLFRKLKGTSDVNEKTVLHLDFMETKQGLPVNLKMITCTLNQLAENCKIITMELFKLANLEA